MRRINVLCAMRDSRVVNGLRRDMDESCLFCTVGSGDVALACAVRVPPDVLIVDAVLQGLDGVGLVERMQGIMGERMPVVIGGSVLSFFDEEFKRLGVTYLVRVPWSRAQLGRMLAEIIREMDTCVDWERAESGFVRAQALLREMGMNDKLHGFAYLAWAAALVHDREERLDAIAERLYGPVAKRYGTTPQSVERLIRHAVERTADTVGETGIYNFFGNTIDPMRGKPTNAQMIARVAQGIRCKRAGGPNGR